MLHLYQSNLTETLFAGLSQIIRTPAKGSSLLTPETVLVQNPDMAQWLKMELAQQQGIAANLQFPLPSSFLWQIFHSLFEGQLPGESPYSKPRMSWHLMQLLPRYANDPRFDWLPEAILEKEPKAELRLYQLCGTLADTFDQYLMYRPDWIAQWEQGEGLDQVEPSQQWQPVLWQALSEQIVKRSGSALHRGRLLQETIHTLNESSNLTLKGLPKRITLFGISAMPEQMLLLLNGLARHMEIHWFQLNPSQEFWLDIVDEKTKARLAASKSYIRLSDLEQDRYFLVGNPLLASMGQLGREHLSLMYEKLEGDWLEEFSDYPTTGALQLLQQEILALHCRGQFESLTAEQLVSNQDKLSLPAEQLANIQFHACYSPMREVEVLKDQLLSAFEADPSLSPNDVLVMMPDVAAYAPFIQAVFEKREGEPFLPYSINDLSARQESPLIDSFLALLALAESRFQVSEIMALLEVPAIMRKFQLTESELATIKHWLQETGVRWGLNGAQREQLELGGFNANSWQFGLKRMLTGYAMHSEQGLFDETLPYDEIEGKSAEALGKLLMFVDALTLTCEELALSREAEVWSLWLASLVNRFYQAEGYEHTLIQGVSQACERMVADCLAAGFEAPIAYPIIRNVLSQALSQSQGGRRFRAGAINFCTLMPMRTIPFKRVCLLGMSDGAFPRATIPTSYDLMAKQRRRGDRSRRLDDRYLFLEAITSCRGALHISWVGRDIRDDTKLPPSILVSELQEYMAQAWMLEGDESLPNEQTESRLLEAMSTAHPLQAYSGSYFQPSEPKSYAKLWADGLNHPSLCADFAAEPLAPEAVDWVELSQLEAMLTNPCQSFLQRRLGIYFDEQQEQDLDAEPFELDALQGWQLKQEALHQGLISRDETCFQQGRHSGQLPIGQAGELLLEKAQESVSSLLLLAKELKNDVPESPVELRVRLQLSHGSIGLLGAVTPAHAARVRYWLKPGRLNPKDLMRAWLRQLLVCAASAEETPMWLIDNDSAQIIQPLAQAEAIGILHSYLEIYCKGLVQPLPFFIRTGWKHQELTAKELQPEALLVQLHKEWLPGFNAIPGEGDDPYIARCYGQLEPNLEKLQELSDLLLKPLLNQLASHKVRGKESYSFKHQELLDELMNSGVVQ